MASRLFSRLRQIVSLILAAWHSVIAIDAFPGTHVACAKAPGPIPTHTSAHLPSSEIGTRIPACEQQVLFWK